MKYDESSQKDSKKATRDRSGDFIVNIDQIWQIVLVLALLFEQVTAEWVKTKFL